MRAKPFRLALGPLLYYWPRDTALAFYEEAAGWPVDIVYLGETVCSRRRELRMDDWLGIAGRLADAGKEVVFSTFELIETDADLRAMRSVVENGRFQVEANDMGAVNLLAGKAPFIAGPFLNVYNAATLALLAELGATRWVAPVELSAAGLRDVLAEAPEGVETEVFAYGRLPLAASARCFTARYHNLTKDHCEYRCIEHPDGMLLSTQDDQPFLVLNGVQTQSARAQNLLPELDEAAAIGADVLRISPQSRGTAEVVRLFDLTSKKEIAADQALAQLNALMPSGGCDGYWHGRPGIENVSGGSAT
jgi:collagenase-like PrtC family protease